MKLEIPEKTFSYSRRVAFADADSMGVVHHSAYIRYFEEARVEWLRARGAMRFHYPNADMCLAVLESECHHLKPARFDDLLRIYVQCRSQRLKFFVQYLVVHDKAPDMVIARGRTMLVPVDSNLKLLRLPTELLSLVKDEPWTETWL